MVICIITGSLLDPNHAEHYLLFVHGQAYNHKVMIKNSVAHFFYGIYMETSYDPATFTRATPSVL